MEFLRFGSSIPGSYWGCCCGDIVQNFKVDPDSPASIELVDGDGGHPISDKFLGMTWKEIFLSRLRIGTFGSEDMPNHFFIAVLTQWQIESSLGMKWLKILRETGFEFIRTVNNSVYSGESLGEPTGDGRNTNDNHVFALFRNIGKEGIRDPYIPPKEWRDLPRVKPELHDCLSGGFYGEKFCLEQHSADTKIWNDIGPARFTTESELDSKGVPVWYAGKRSSNPQRLRPAKKATTAPVVNPFSKSLGNPFLVKAD